MTSVLKPVFIDASSAILLEKSGLFLTFSNAFQLIMARSVFKEITAPGHKGVTWFRTQFEKRVYKVIALSCNSNSENDLGCYKNFGTGERDTLCLYHEAQQGFILIDDGPAARWCTKQNIPFINALLVPKILMYKNLITKEDCENKMDILCGIGRYSKKIKTIAFALTRKELSYFIITDKKNED